ncbi:hypothetical protein ACIQTU_07410 [Brevundimonas sp. NPDC090276]|jgi:type VI protein secretion system component VasK|uniref:hypothetical protein n=1 Tax=Brevundimonas TaxID=41275 RepID=UPI000E0AEBCD|nr:hypothetical protein [Brevundimonas bullata]MBD3834148.1 hypothetical protein [Brevundimonas sp.]WQE35550.1 hypothetical protein U0030_09590 [Brevundimonas bullata]HUH09604.1 hypothetical protein [Brevundimonas sp.]HUH23685.1 hypothetical protein [Brevundimonas sp.]
MTRPNLDSDEGRAAYRAELRRVGWPLRWGGLALILVAAGMVLAVKDGKWLSEDLLIVAYGLLAAGWALVVTAIFMRTRHHKRRLAEGL